MKSLFILIILISLISCTENQPTQIDSYFEYQAYIMDVSGIFETDTIPLNNAMVTLTSNSYFDVENNPKIYLTYSQSDGFISFSGLPSSKYTLTALKDTFLIDPQTGNHVPIRLYASREIQISSFNLNDKALLAKITLGSGIVINELYYCGPDNDFYYVYDQFVELYNPTDSTLYLDGLIIARARPNAHPDMENMDYVQVNYFYKFPGTSLTSRLYPIEPGEFIAIASDGFDHTTILGTSIDLSQADWEFYNPLGRDIDYPPPNVENNNPDHTSDFLISLTHNAVVLADGSEWYFGEERDGADGQYVHIPISTILDVVEYSSNVESSKHITVRLDAGFAGIGMQKYSGKSVQRREPGFDTNNSNIDFVIIDNPTPGYQN